MIHTFKIKKLQTPKHQKKNDVRVFDSKDLYVLKFFLSWK